jgi:hypothetical protein
LQIKSDALQSPLVLKIFSTHLADTASAPEGLLEDNYPRGALVLSLSAVSHSAIKLEIVWGYFSAKKMFMT